MPEIVGDPPAPACYRLFPGTEIEESQTLGSDSFSPRARARAAALPAVVPAARAAGGITPRVAG
jgi:hypothetical protein